MPPSEAGDVLNTEEEKQFANTILPDSVTYI